MFLQYKVCKKMYHINRAKDWASPCHFVVNQFTGTNGHFNGRRKEEGRSQDRWIEYLQNKCPPHTYTYTLILWDSE